MKIEYEAKFLNINKNEIRERLKKAGAELAKPEFLQKRFNFHLPGDLRDDKVWLRVRNEGDKITLSLKRADGREIHHQKELALQVNDFDTAVEILKSIGCEIRMYQETKRELWTLDGAEITIDEWPFLEPLVEVENDSEKNVRSVSEKLGFNWDEAVFGPVGRVYKMKYKIGPSIFEGKDMRLTFEGKNPFENLK
jgi:adenylate cyclase, class 2